MFYHVANVSAPNNVVINTSETDCLVIALGCYHLFDPSLKTWIEAGLQTNNTQRYISINQIHASLGEILCISVHASVTGCDYTCTASFIRKGKVKPLNLLQKKPRSTISFHSVGM